MSRRAVYNLVQRQNQSSISKKKRKSDNITSMGKQTQNNNYQRY